MSASKIIRPTFYQIVIRVYKRSWNEDNARAKIMYRNNAIVTEGCGGRLAPDRYSDWAPRKRSI